MGHARRLLKKEALVESFATLPDRGLLDSCDRYKMLALFHCLHIAQLHNIQPLEIEMDAQVATSPTE
ncbi:hypothetical protein KY290_031178 [Solanum tuberosum]|uniref:Uncharacterized protein n=1 Tax=Solanum tuberosum TaxID=4113 RepID=A0ABQ7U8F0_SOLTU|nr:hypothetical protein KY290_031178 [Solanum tuberosum]